MKFTFGGGINEVNDIAISPDEAVSGQNFELRLGETKLRPRAPFDLLDTATNTSNIHGLHQLIKRDDTKTTLVAAGTDMYTWTGSVFTDVGNVASSSIFKHFSWDLDETIIIVDRVKANVVLEWDGTTLSNLAHNIPAVTSLYAKYGLVHNGRAILGNVTTDAVENPHMLAVSAFEDRQDFDTSKRSGDGSFTTGLEAFYLLTPDLHPINGLIKFKRSLICSTTANALYELIGDDSTNYRWEPFYAGSGAIGDDSFVNAGDDVFYIRQGGIIESLRATNQFGDVGTDDISIPVRNTMKDNTGSQIVYDQTNQKILFWLGGSILVLFKNMLRTERSPFSIYKTNHTSQFTTNAVEYMELPDSSNKTVLFGDSSGNIYDLNGSGLNGDGGTDSVQTIRKMPLQEYNYETFIDGRVFYRRVGECELSITFEWGDEQNTTDLIVPLKGRSGASNKNYFGGGKYFGGSEYFGEGDPVGNPVSKGFSAIGKGSSVFVELQLDTVNKFEIDYIESPGE